MSESTLQLDIPILLPDVEDERDPCVSRLQERLTHRRGIERVHIKRENGTAQLCLHYDTNLVSLSQVQRIAEESGAAITERYHHESLDIGGIDCADCAFSIEHILGRVTGILTVRVNPASRKMWVEYDTEKVTHDDIVRRMAGMGYPVEEEISQNWFQRNWELVLAVLSGAFLALGFFGSILFQIPEPVALGLYVLAYLAGGFNTARHGIEAALHLRFDVDFLMVVAAIGAAVLGEWAEGALLLFLFSLGHALEHYAMDRARNAIRALGELTPKSARVRRDGRETELPVEELVVGDVVVVRSGERIPVDGEVLEGQSAVDQAPVTGESVPVEKGPGDTVFAGTVNSEGALDVEVTRLAADTTLARVIQMVEEAQSQQSPTQRFTDRFTSIFVPVVLVLVILVIAVPPLAGWLPFADAFLRGMTVLVAASPCALAIATPSAVLSGVGQAARNGVLIKGGVHLENLGRVDAIALDKTGTVTLGEPRVTDVISFDGGSEIELLRIAAAVESRSTHPLAQGVVEHAEARDIDYQQASDFLSVTGRGVTAQLNGQRVRIGSLDLYDERPVPETVVSRVRTLETAGKTTMLVAVEEAHIGVIALADRPREVAQGTLTRLRELGIKALIMLTGDNERVASAIAEEVGLTDYRASLMPEEKVEAVKALLDKYGRVAMIGDGVNDAPALATSTVGIAMGAGGTDVALETADVALMADDLSRLPFAVGLSRQSRRIIQQNLYISLGVVLLLIIASLTGFVGIGLAVVFHEGSTLAVVLNALRLLAYGE